MRVLAYILPIIWILLGLLWYYPKQKERCCQAGGETSLQDDQDSLAGQTGENIGQEAPLSPDFYQIDQVTPLNEAQLRSQLRRNYDDLGENQVLEIRGRYYGNEGVPDDSENLGLARASYLNDLLGSDVDDSKIALSAFRIGDSIESGNLYFKGVDLNSITTETPSVE